MRELGAPGEGCDGMLHAKPRKGYLDCGRVQICLNLYLQAMTPTPHQQILDSLQRAEQELQQVQKQTHADARTVELHEKELSILRTKLEAVPV